MGIVVRLSGERDEEEWLRRRSIEAVLNPDRSIKYNGLDVAVDLATRYRWNVEPTDHAHTRACHTTRTISTPPIYGDAELACFVHEGGHVEDTDNATRVGRLIRSDGILWSESLESEFFAWRFALKTLGFRWNATMQSSLEKHLRTYHGVGLVLSHGDLMALNAVIADGAEQARGVVRILTR
jgi:hypothetical protein